MRLRSLLKPLALIVFLAALAGATYGVSAILGNEPTTIVAKPNANADVLGETRSATPGHDVTIPVRILNRGASSADFGVVVTGLGPEARSALVTAFAAGNQTVFVKIHVPEGTAPGAYALDARVVNATGDVVRERPGLIHLNVLAPATSGFAEGDSADVTYTGRINATGTVFSTNDPALVGQQFATTEGFPSTISTRTLNVATLPRVSVVTGFYEGMLGMQENESRTVTFGPEKGYGNATVEQSQERETVLPRAETLPLPGADLTPDQFASYLNQTSQGKPEDYHVGSIVTNERNGDTLRYRITQMDDSVVKLVLDVHVGERYTLYEVWPNSSVVTDIANGNVSFETTPPVALHEAFSYYSYWPGMSEVTQLNDTSIVVRHSPTVGLQYTTGASQISTPQSFTVKELRDDEIVVTTANPNSLAGKDLQFDIRIVKLHKGS